MFTSNSIETQVKMIDKAGLHARPASLLAKMATSYKDTQVFITYNGKRVNAKMVVKILALGVPCGATVSISAEGVDARLAVNKISVALAVGLDNESME